MRAKVKKSKLEHPQPRSEFYAVSRSPKSIWRSLISVDIQSMHFMHSFCRQFLYLPCGHNKIVIIKLCSSVLMQRKMENSHSAPWPSFRAILKPCEGKGYEGFPKMDRIMMSNTLAQFIHFYYYCWHKCCEFNLFNPIYFCQHLNCYKFYTLDTFISTSTLGGDLGQQLFKLSIIDSLSRNLVSRLFLCLIGAGF